MSKPIDQERELKRCAACRKERPVSEMKTCMHNQMHRYVCDSKCMHDFYNPPKAEVHPAGVAVPDGWRLVPAEPTEEMKLASVREHNKSPGWYCRHKAAYRAMLAAAPHPVSVPESMRSAAAAEMNRLGYGHHESHAESILIAAGALHPVSGERFPVKRYGRDEVAGHSDVEIVVPGLTHYDHGPNLAEALARLAYRVAKFHKLDAPTLCAQRPVSGEQKQAYPVIRHVRPHSHKCANVQLNATSDTACDCGAVVSGVAVEVAPAAQDVDGLASSATAYLDALDSGADEYDTKRARHAMRQALAAHRAQQGEQKP